MCPNPTTVKKNQSRGTKKKKKKSTPQNAGGHQGAGGKGSGGKGKLRSQKNSSKDGRISPRPKRPHEPRTRGPQANKRTNRVEKGRKPPHTE